MTDTLFFFERVEKELPKSSDYYTMFEISEISRVCSSCKHLISVKDRKCKAFEKIPLNIWEGLHKHKSPYFGDNGFRYSSNGLDSDEEFVLDDFELTIPVISFQCCRCFHFVGGRSCSAFKQIPLEIWVGYHDHTLPFPGDSGLLFTNKK